MQTSTITMNVTVNGRADPPVVYTTLADDETRRALAHFIDHALHKITALFSSNATPGSNKVTFTCVTTLADGTVVGDQTNNWNALDDATVTAMRGIFAGALGALDHRISAKKHG